MTLRSLQRWVADIYKPAMPPARDAIDALLDGGATAAPNALKAPVQEADQAYGHATSSPAHGYAALDAKLKTIDAKASEAPSKPAKRRKKLDSSHLEYNPDGSDIDDEDGAQDLRKQQSEKKAKRVKSIASDQKRGNVSLGSEDGSEVTTHAVRTAVKDKAHDPGESATAKESHKIGGKKASHVGTKTAPVAKAGKAKATPQLASLSQPLVAEPSGRPFRKAKKTALGKLKAKRGKESDDAMSDTDDESESEDNASSFGAKDDKPHVAARGRPKAHLPTPVTKSATSKRDGTSKPSGKLQSVKSKAQPTTASVKKVPGNTATNPRTRRDTSLVGGGSVVNSTEKEFDEPGTKSRRKTLVPADDDEQNDRGKSPVRRPGALKRPARSASRGRVPLQKIRYDFPGSTPRVKRNKRSVSRASRASVKPGATRQRMQSESVNHHDDSKKDNSRQLSTSRRAASREVEAGSPPRKKSTTQNKSKELPPQPKPNHNNKSALQPEHTGIAAKVETQKNAATVKSTTSRQKPGSSQGNAIMIEQASQTSSSPSPSPHQDTTVRPNAAGENKRRPEVRRMQTPAVMPSSPPAGDIKTVHTLAKDRPTIIAFSKRGPRNQGISSASKDSGSDFAPAASAGRGAADAGLRDQGKGLARTLFPTQDHAPVTMVPSNVSVSVDETFADFTKNGKNKALTSLLQRQTAAASKSARHKSEPEQQLDEDDGFFVIDDFDDTTLVNDDKLSEKENVPRTASQIAMPPPNGPEKIVKVTAQKPLLEKPAKTITKPAIANPVPEPQKPKKVVLAATTKAAVEPKPAKPATKVESKNETTSASVQKVTKTVPINDAVETRPAKRAPAEQKAQPKRKRELNEMQPGSPEKKTKTLQKDPPKASSSDDASARQLRSSKIPQGAKVVIADPVERPDRRRNRPNRRTTQGSQGVDILGSPYPKELEVPIQTTALEIFSQQANLSSDQMLSSDAVVPGGLAGRLNLAAVPQILPPTHLKPISSNGKPLPAAPNESSRAATRIASGSLAEQLITAKHEQSVMEDPFTSSHGHVPLVPIVKQTAKKPDFKEALRKQGIIIDQPKRTADRDEDPDKTLVNPTEDLESDSPKDVASSTGASDELSNASSVSAAQKTLENVGDWRNTLKPHQAHLFDSLLIASHRLVRHMVDSETAHRDIVADYRRQGEIVVTELERAHAREFQQYATGMLERKKAAADGLASLGKRLKMDVKEAERVRGERREQAKQVREGYDVMLEELVARLG